jgi:hypothetical protein
MNTIKRLIGTIVLTTLLPVAANAAGDPFLGTWRLNKARSIIAKDPGVKSKEFVFTPRAQGVLITETLEMLTEAGKKHHAEIPYAYGKPVAQAGPGLDTLLVVKGDDRTAYWTALNKGQIVSQLQVVVSEDNKRMTFRYLWAAADVTGRVPNDRYVYEKSE